MSDATSEFDPVEPLIDEFLDRRRAGERPSLAEFADAHPEYADRLRSLIPAMLAMEELGLDGGSGPGAGGRASRAVAPRRLGDYRLIRPIGSGGMGIVYEAVQESLGRHVALKTVAFHRDGDATGLERFRRETLAAARLQHPHIVPVFGVGEHEGLHFYTMQFIDGLGLDVVLREIGRRRADVEADDPTTERDLSSTLARDLYDGRFYPQSLPGTDAGSRSPAPSTARLAGSRRIESRYFDSVAWLGVQAAEALDYAHRHGVLHRDIKPSNLLMDAGGHVWVTDFGLAKIQDGDELTRTGDVVGTLRYMAPERFNGWSDPRSDVFALGATLYELLTFRPAFDEEDRIRLVDRLLHGAPTPPRRLDRRFPADLETIVMKALANDAGGRYATAGQLAEDLRRFVARRPILARRSGRLERGWRWCRRNPAIAGAAVAVVSALATTAAISLAYAYEQRQAASEIRKLADAEAEAREGLRASLAATQRLLARQDFDRGQAAFEKGEVGAGLLWTLESWRSARDAGDLDWQRLALANVSAWGELSPRLVGFLSHDGPVSAAAFSPDGKTILTGGDDRTARFWDAASSRPIGDPLPYPAAVQCVAFSPDGKTALIGCADGEARLWDVRGRRAIGPPLRHPGGVLCAAFRPDGKAVATGGDDGEARIWDAATGSPISSPHASSRPITGVAFNPAGDRLASVSRDYTARIRDASTGRLIGPPLEHSSEIHSLAFQPGGDILVTGGWNGWVRFWDVSDGRLIEEASSPHRGHVRSIAFSPDGKTYATASEDKTARLWDAVTRRPVGPPLIHQGPVTAVAFRPDGKALLTASSDHAVRVWDVDSCRGLRPSGEVQRAGIAVAFLPGGKTFLGGSAVSQLFDAATGERLGNVMAMSGRVRSVAVSPDGKTFVVGGYPPRLWDAATQTQIGAPLDHPGGGDVVAFSPDGRLVATGGADRTSRVWDAATGAPVGEPIAHPGSVDCLTFRPDGALVVGLDAGGARAWDPASRTPLGPVFEHPGAVSTVAASPEGRAILTGCEDGMARLWDAATGELLAPPLPHQAWVFAVAFRPDGRAALTGSRDHTARIWDVATGQPIGPAFRHPGDIWSASFAPDGRSILTGDVFSRAKLFPVAPEWPFDLERAAARVEVLTGLRLDAARRLIQPLDNASWHAAHDRLRTPGATGVEKKP